MGHSTLGFSPFVGHVLFKGIGYIFLICVILLIFYGRTECEL